MVTFLFFNTQLTNTMLIDKSGNRTRLQPGDVMTIDTDNEMIVIRREGKVDDLGYWMMPRDGVQIEILAALIADTAGLSCEGLKDEQYPSFRFSL